MVWRTSGKEFDPKCTFPTVKHGDVLGLFHPSELENCVLDRIMDRFYYGDILEQNLQPSINYFKLSQRCIIMHDNHPKRNTSGLIKDWLKRKRIQTLLVGRA